MQEDERRNEPAEARVINLILAFIWAVVGVGLIVYHATTNDQWGRIHLIDGNFSMGWAALVLCAYNLVRYWARRMMLAHRRLQDEMRFRRAEMLAKKPRPQYGDPNPDFMFTDEPPPPKDDRTQEKP